MPQMRPLYTALRTRQDQLHPDVTAKVGKTQISLRNRYVSATVSPPDLDEAVMRWVEEAYQFSMEK